MSDPVTDLLARSPLVTSGWSCFWFWLVSINAVLAASTAFIAGVPLLAIPPGLLFAYVVRSRERGKCST